MRDLELLLADVEPGGLVAVRGWELRKAREEEAELLVVGGLSSVRGAGDKRAVKDASRDAFRASVNRST